MEHDPVMVAEVLAALELQSGDTVVDGTIGLGGHSKHFLSRVGESGTLIGFDYDASMLEIAKSRLEGLPGKKFFFQNNFREIQGILSQIRVSAVKGILLDLGLNLNQILDPSRGITFKEEGPLDMRQDRSTGEPASALLNRLSPIEIERILWENGDERWAKAIARKIVERRKDQPLRTTTDLVECVLAAIPAGARDKRIHPATRTFQAVRMEVNGDLDGLDDALNDAAESLAPGGVLAVLSYHSGEDRIVKTTFKELAASGKFEDLYKKPLAPSATEIERNPRSRSAKLRAIKRREGSA